MWLDVLWALALGVGATAAVAAVATWLLDRDKDRAGACNHEWSHIGERVVIGTGRQFSRRCAGCGAQTEWVKEDDLAAAPMRRADAMNTKRG